ncbi:hypothetical protein Tco_0578933 [Tanacetum coccineum]
MTSKSNNSELTMVLNSEIAFLSTSMMKKNPMKDLNQLSTSSDQNSQADQNDHNDQNDHPITEPLSSLTKDTSTPNIVSLAQTKSPSSIPVPQDRWSIDKHIELVNIIGNLGAGMLTRAMAKELSVASTHECLFVDFLLEEEHKKVSKALKHPRWVDAM